MNNQFMIGDLVVCKVGGPTMIISHAPVSPLQAPPLQNALGNVQFLAGGFQIQQPGPPLNANRMYSCLWWNGNSWQAWSFHEDMLEKAQVNV